MRLVPLTALTALTALVGGLALAGCGHHGSASTGSTIPPSAAPTTPVATASATPTTPGPSAAQLTASLPRLTDVPHGWAIDSTATLTSEMTARDTDPVSPTSCTRASQVQENFNFAEPATAHAHADFLGSSHGPFVGVTVYAYAGAYPASAFAAIRAAVRQCPSYVESDDGQEKVRDHVSIVSVPRIGDESLGVRVSSVLGGTNAELIVLLVRSQHTLIAVEEAALGQPADRARVERLARTTASRLPPG